MQLAWQITNFLCIFSHTKTFCLSNASWTNYVEITQWSVFAFKEIVDAIVVARTGTVRSYQFDASSGLFKLMVILRKLTEPFSIRIWNFQRSWEFSIQKKTGGLFGIKERHTILWNFWKMDFLVALYPIL